MKIKDNKNELIYTSIEPMIKDKSEDTFKKTWNKCVLWNIDILKLSDEKCIEKFAKKYVEKSLITNIYFDNWVKITI